MRSSPNGDTLLPARRSSRSEKGGGWYCWTATFVVVVADCAAATAGRDQAISRAAGMRSERRTKMVRVEGNKVWPDTKTIASTCRTRGFRGRFLAGSAKPTLDSARAESSVRALRIQARSSVVEHYLDTVGVGGSIPPAPTTLMGGPSLPLTGPPTPRRSVRRSHTTRPLEFGGPSLPLTAPQTPASQRGEATLRAFLRGARAEGRRSR